MISPKRYLRSSQGMVEPVRFSMYLLRIEAQESRSPTLNG